MSEKDKNAIKYIANLYIFLTLSTSIVIIRNINYIVNKWLIEFIFTLLLIITIFSLSFYLLIKFKIIHKISKSTILEYLPMIFIFIVLFILSCDGFLMYPKWDSLDYYNAIIKIDINTFNDISYLKLCKHMSIVYSILVYLLYCIVGNYFISAVLLNIIFNMLGAICIYKMVKAIAPKSSNIFAYLCSVIFAFSPFTLGMNSYIFLDNVMMYAFLFFMYAVIIKNKNLTFMTSIFLMFSKEQGIIFTFIFIFIPIIISLIKSCKLHKFKSEIKNQLSTFNICQIIINFAFVIIFLLGNWAKQGGWYEFALNYNHIVNSLNNIITLNFNWILFLIVIIDFIWISIKNHRENISLKTFIIHNIGLFKIFLAGIIMMCFNFIVITWNHPRYHLIEIIVLYLLAFFALNDMYQSVKNKRIKFQYIIMPIIFFLLFVQSYITIDPIMLVCNNKIYMGENNNYIVATKWLYYEPDFGRFVDCAVYNKQANYYELVFDKLLTEIEYNTNICLVAGSHESYFIKGMAWDNSNKRRYFTNDEDKMIKYMIINENNLDIEWNKNLTYYFIDFHSGTNSHANERSDKDVYYYFSENSSVQIDQLKDVEMFGWKFTYCKLSII